MISKIELGILQGRVIFLLCGDRFPTDGDISVCELCSHFADKVREL